MSRCCRTATSSCAARCTSRPTTSEGKFALLGSDPAELFSTIVHNIEHADAPWLQRKVAYDNIGAEALPALQDETRQAGLDFVRRANALLASYDRDRHPDAPGGARSRVVVGVYYFEEPVAALSRRPTTRRRRAAAGARAHPEEAMSWRPRWPRRWRASLRSAARRKAASPAPASALVSGNVTLVSDAGAQTARRCRSRSASASPSSRASRAPPTRTAPSQLRGDFSGAVTLQFANAADGAEIGPLTLEIPAGSQTVLENIEIRTNAPPPERVRPPAVRQLDVFGRLDLVECSADGSGTLLVSDDGRPPRQFMVAPDRRHRDRRRATGAAGLRGCRPGAVVAASRACCASRDQTIVAVRVVVVAARAAAPQPGPRPERLRGMVTAVACPRG